MRDRKKILNKLLMKAVIFAVVIFAAVLFDVYLERNNLTLDDIEADSGKSSNEMGAIHFVSQANIITIKSSFTKTPGRKIQVNSQDKHIQKYHQLRNYKIFKAKVHSEIAPQVLSYHYLGFKNFHITLADDDDPLIS